MRSVLNSSSIKTKAKAFLCTVLSAFFVLSSFSAVPLYFNVNATASEEDNYEELEKNPDHLRVFSVTDGEKLTVTVNAGNISEVKMFIAAVGFDENILSVDNVVYGKGFGKNSALESVFESFKFTDMEMLCAQSSFGTSKKEELFSVTFNILDTSVEKVPVAFFFTPDPYKLLSKIADNNYSSFDELFECRKIGVFQIGFSDITPDDNENGSEQPDNGEFVKLTVIENTHSQVKIQLSVRNYAELEACELLFNYDKNIFEYQDFKAKDKSSWRVDSRVAGELRAAGVFEDSLGDDAETYLLTITLKRISDEESDFYLSGDMTAEVKVPDCHTREKIYATDPGCERTGLTEGEFCPVCGKVFVEQEIIPATGHTEVTVEAVAPGCETTGLTEGKHCTECIKVFVEQEIIPATGHTEVTDEAVAPGCETTGLTVGRHCSVCDKVFVKQETVAATGHSLHHEITAATCKTAGAEFDSCTVCNAVFNYKIIPAVAHSFGEWTEISGASCTDNGVKARYCTVCSDSEIAVIPATGHTEVTDKEIPPGCETTGLTEGKHCSVCEKVLVEQEIVSFAGHKWGEWKTEIPASQQEEGLETRSCSVCSEAQYRKTEKLPVTDIEVNETEEIKSFDDCIIVTEGVSVKTLLDKVTYGTEIITKDSENADSEKLLSSSMKAVLKDKNGKVSDEMTVIVLADVDGDGVVTATDARLALRASVELENLNGWQQIAADADSSKEIAATDARAILRIAVGLEKAEDYLKKSR